MSLSNQQTPKCYWGNFILGRFSIRYDWESTYWYLKIKILLMSLVLHSFSMWICFERHYTCVKSANSMFEVMYEWIGPSKLCFYVLVISILVIWSNELSLALGGIVCAIIIMINRTIICISGYAPVHYTAHFWNTVRFCKTLWSILSFRQTQIFLCVFIY